MQSFTEAPFTQGCDLHATFATFMPPLIDQKIDQGY